MSFNDSVLAQKSPLVEGNDSKHRMEELEKKLKYFNKTYNKMKIYFDKLVELTRVEYDDIKDEVYKINKFLIKQY
jgi:hypothetical protein